MKIIADALQELQIDTGSNMAEFNERCSHLMLQVGFVLFRKTSKKINDINL